MAEEEPKLEEEEDSKMNGSHRPSLVDLSKLERLLILKKSLFMPFPSKNIKLLITSLERIFRMKS